MICRYETFPTIKKGLKNAKKASGAKNITQAINEIAQRKST